MRTNRKLWGIVLVGVLLLTSCVFGLKTYSTKAQGSDLNFVVLPDLQNENGEVLDSICQWILDNQASQNIQAVVSVGDLTNNATDAEFQRLLPCFDRLNNSGLIVLPIVGNHDYDRLVPRSTSKFDQYFGPTYFAGKTWYGGNYNGSNANYYVKFTVGTRKYMIVALEFYPRPEAVTWASSILDANPDYETIITTHAFLNPNGSRTQDTDAYGPNYYGLPSTDNNGEELWNNLIKLKPNIKMLMCGHFLSGNTSRRSDVGIYGNTVHQLFNNWQEVANGGDGWIGIVKLNSINSTANVSYIKTYNPPFSLSWPVGTISPNVAPVVNAGSDQIITTTSTSLTGLVTDDGRPATGSLTTIWSKVTGPGNAEFASPDSASTNVSFEASGTYTLRLTASDGEHSAYDEVVVFANLQTAGSWYQPAWLFMKDIIIPQGKASTDLLNFPVLVSLTDPDLKFADNGGKVLQPQGNDVVFTDGAEQKLPYEIEKYNPTTGELVAWVKVPLLAKDSDTVLHIYFGNAAAENQQNKTEVWDSRYMAVWHLSEKSGSQYGSTIASNTLVSVAVQSAGQENGKIGGSDVFGTASHVAMTSANSPSLKKQFAKMSISAWIKPSAFTSAVYGPTVISNTDSDGWAMRVNNGYLVGDLRLSSGTSVSRPLGPQLPLNTWSYVSIVYDGTRVWGYINGAAVDSVAGTGFVKNAGNTATCTSIGNEVTGCALQGSEFPFKGEIDEVRVSDDSRSSAWIAAEYANQSNPAAFIIVSGTIPKP